MFRKVKEYRPSSEDKKWLIDTLDVLKDKGRIITDLVVYKKTELDNGKYQLSLVCINNMISELGMGIYEVNMEVFRMKKLCESLDVVFIDGRKEVWN